MIGNFKFERTNKNAYQHFLDDINCIIECNMMECICEIFARGLVACGMHPRNFGRGVGVT